MNQDLGLKVLSEIMSWTDEQARDEFAWLRFIARLKYDGYRDFKAGVRFIESLATWLQQFEKNERACAYDFVRRTLVFVGPIEMNKLIELFYPREVYESMVLEVASNLDIPTYSVLSNTTAQEEIKKLRRKTLFMGLSDGARIDVLRHSNVGTLINEQLVVATQVDQDKWEDLLTNLRKDLRDPNAKFSRVYLIDDFTGTGTSFLRYNHEKKKWSGKLSRFNDSIVRATESLNGDSLFEDNWTLCVHHYLATAKAVENISTCINNALKFFADSSLCFDIRCSYGMTLPEDFPINANPTKNIDFINLTQKYYDPILRTPHTDVGGVEHLGLGYGGCALPLVLDHNTPNNSIALLWAETPGGQQDDGSLAPAMRPLFRRRQRHT